MRYIIIAMLGTIALAAFQWPKCEHVFTQVEQALVKIEQPEFKLGGQLYQEYSWPSGLQEGKDLICVKCFHKQKQVLDYGASDKTTGLTEWLHSRILSTTDTCLPLTTHSISFDTSGIIILKSPK